MMTPSNDTPFKRFSAFWFVMGLFLLFGAVAFAMGLLKSDDSATAADKYNAARRLAIKETVAEEQMANLTEKKSEEGMQVPPRQAFDKVASLLVNSKPLSVQEERQRDPSLAPAEPATEKGDEAVETEGATTPANENDGEAADGPETATEPSESSQ